MLIEGRDTKAMRFGLFILLYIQSSLATSTYTKSAYLSQNLTSRPTVLAPVVPSYPFRRDLFTAEECNLYFTLGSNGSMCLLIPGSRLCAITEKSPRRFVMMNTYVEVPCLHPTRSQLVKTTQRVSQISPQRAVVLHLDEEPDKEDLVTVDVIEPIRNQTVHIGIIGCYSPNTTARVYEVGTIPNLHSFALYNCHNQAVRKSDFGRMPQIRQIVLTLCTINMLEPGTFTDLPHLRSLVLERQLILALFSAKNPSGANSSVNANYLDYLYNLHCDCSFAWLRRFLNQMPDLIEAKDAGEVFIVGNYVSTAVKRNGNDTEVFSVDCSKKITLENIWAGNEFSYNASCSDVIC
ncbi:uncharacterized protein LOC129598072 [Paramacrobiotus metropolitanus]|uniref:uncharacterized protein LOC129598072 n=1 Tax=Paramacrobiotus metropolitanus TaxID=2943436 RepID=UPI0024457F65|nr:uncharacterized protein LOC129598072 [Paramacrobiotus metropolitanus]